MSYSKLKAIKFLILSLFVVLLFKPGVCIFANENLEIPETTKIVENNNENLIKENRENNTEIEKKEEHNLSNFMEPISPPQPQPQPIPEQIPIIPPNTPVISPPITPRREIPTPQQEPPSPNSVPVRANENISLENKTEDKKEKKEAQSQQIKKNAEENLNQSPKLPELSSNEIQKFESSIPEKEKKEKRNHILRILISILLIISGISMIVVLVASNYKTKSSENEIKSNISNDVSNINNEDAQFILKNNEENNGSFEDIYKD